MNDINDSAVRPQVNDLMETILGYRKAKVLMVASYIGCFNHLQRPASAADLARKLSLDGRALEILLDALAALGYLTKQEGRYQNSDIADRFLVEGSSSYLGDNLKYQEIIWDAWSDLRGTLKRGTSERPLEYWLLRHKGFIQEYIRGMDNIAKIPAEEIVSLVGTEKMERMLDVGAGPGTYSVAFARSNPRLRATLLDIPQTLKITQGILSEMPEISERCILMPANYRDADFGDRVYDLVLLSHITHDENPKVNANLIQKSFKALKKGGRVVIHDFMLEENRVSPEFGALFSVHMLAYTQGGRTYTALEYIRWLRAAGFVSFTRHKIATKAKNSSEIIVAIK